jgi:hypothetical protein
LSFDGEYWFNRFLPKWGGNARNFFLLKYKEIDNGIYQSILLDERNRSMYVSASESEKKFSHLPRGLKKFFLWNGRELSHQSISNR